MVAALAAGKYSVGNRLPAERELAAQYEVSRKTVREAIIALEVQGLVEVRMGSGAYVMRLPGYEGPVGYGMSAFELIEARLVIEGEATALAATMVTNAEISEIDGLVRYVALENCNPKGSEFADRDFHIAIAKATRNNGMLGAVTRLWELRDTSTETALLNALARNANIKLVNEEHNAILEALRERNPADARAAMRAHLATELDRLLFVTEEWAVDEAHRAVQGMHEL